MDTDKLIIGGVVIVALIIALPIIVPMVYNEHAYDPVADSHKLEELNGAINTYTRQHGQYPPSLFHLAPDYLDEIPLTSTNQQFEYDPATGAITNPAAPKEETAKSDDKKKRSRRSGSGGTAATEAMTGVGVSEELNF